MRGFVGVLCLLCLPSGRPLAARQAKVPPGGAAIAAVPVVEFVFPYAARVVGASGTPLETRLEFTNGTLGAAELLLTYRYTSLDAPCAGPSEKAVTLTVPPRQTHSDEDVIGSLFGVQGSTAGTIRVGGAGAGRVIARGWLQLGTGSAADVKYAGIGAFSTGSPEALSATNQVVLSPGLTYVSGTAIEVVLGEIAGKPLSVRLKWVDGASGLTIGASDILGLAPYETRAIRQRPFSGDRANVQVAVEYSSGDGSAAALAITRDLATNSFLVVSFAPAGPQVPCCIPRLRATSRGEAGGTAPTPGDGSVRGLELQQASSFPGAGILPPPVITSLKATPDRAAPGTPVRLDFACTMCDAASINGSSVPLCAPVTVTPLGTGTMRYTLSAEGPGGTATADVSVILDSGTCSKPAAPVGTAPADRSTLTTGGAPVTLTWNAPAGAFAYDLYLDTVSPPARLVASNLVAPQGTATGGDVSYAASSLTPGSIYYWKLVAKGDPGCLPQTLAESSVLSFSIAAICSQPAWLGSSVSPAPDPKTPNEQPVVSGTSVPLVWPQASGASSYAVYFGTSSPPPVLQEQLEATSLTVRDLVPGATYRWFVVARASCDPAKTVGTPELTFKVAGDCGQPRSFDLTSPAPDARNVPARTTLAWNASANAASYDVYLGTVSPPPLFQAGVVGTRLDVSGLQLGALYSWRVEARSGCSTASAPSPTLAFTVSGACDPPAKPSFAFVPPGKVGAGETYVLAWRDVGTTSADGYEVERSTDPAFVVGVERHLATGTTATFVAATAGSYRHRVRAVLACGAAGPFSDVAPVEADPGRAVVVFTKQVSGLVVGLGPDLSAAVQEADPDGKARLLEIQNVSGNDLAIRIAREYAGASFFRVEDPTGRPTWPAIVLKPKERRELRVEFENVPASREGAYIGSVDLLVEGQPVTPYCFVSLKVGGQPGAAPIVLVDGRPSEYAYFPAFAGTDDSGRLPLTVKVKNPGPGALEIVPEIGPELWLQPDPTWNTRPLAAGEERPLALRTLRLIAPSGSAFPRYTYLTVRTRDGKSARVLVQDNDVPAATVEPRSFLPPGSPSFIVPSVVSSATFISKLRLSNAGTEPVDADLIFTSAKVDGAAADGFDPAAIRKFRLVVPPRDAVSLTDPLVQVFRLEPPAVGTLEIRAAPERIGFLTVSSAVDAPRALGGSYGFQLPVLARGDGATLGETHAIVGISQTERYRTNLILVETTGRDKAFVKLRLFDRSGALLGERFEKVPRYGQAQINGLASGIGSVSTLEAGRLELTVDEGGGTVAGVVTVIDNASQDAVTYRSVPVTAKAGSSVRKQRVARPGWARVGSEQTTALVIPAVVNGIPAFRGRDDGPTFRSLMGLSSGTLAGSTFRLTYREVDSDGNPTRQIEKTVTVPGRGTVEFGNVLVELFGLAPGERSNGPVFIDADLSGDVYSKVYSNGEEGSLGDSFPVVPVHAAAVVGGANRLPLQVDGLERSLDFGRGTRSNLILNEITGRPVTVAVRLYEAGNRSRPIGEETVSLNPYQKVQLSTLFDFNALSSAGRRERTNVLCLVEPVAGEGLALATVTTIDNKTADTRNSVLTPGGLPPPGGWIGR